jgi:plastocyanin
VGRCRGSVAMCTSDSEQLATRPLIRDGQRPHHAVLGVRGAIRARHRAPGRVGPCFQPVHRKNDTLAVHQRWRRSEGRRVQSTADKEIVHRRRSFAFVVAEEEDNVSCLSSYFLRFELGAEGQQDLDGPDRRLARFLDGGLQCGCYRLATDGAMRIVGVRRFWRLGRRPCAGSERYGNERRRHPDHALTLRISHATARPLSQAWISAEARLAVVGLVVLLLSGCATGASGAPPSESVLPSGSPPSPVTVTLEDNRFAVPGGEEVDGTPVLTIPVGTTVLFENAGIVDHTASQFEDGTFDPFEAAFHVVLSPGSTGTVTFDEPGTVEVGCTPHPDMKMLVIVE